MRKAIGAAALGLVLAACGHATTTGSARDAWVTPTGQATATRPTRLDPKAGAVTNAAKRFHGYDSRYNTPENAPSDFGLGPPPVQPAVAY